MRRLAQKQASLRAFTLLEVMVAMAILALGLTTVLSSQTGLFATTRRVQFETEAATLLRCKMSELELQLIQEGYPLLDERDSGECCEDEDNDFRCEWTIETIELPQPPEFSETDIDEDSESGVDSGSDLGAAIPSQDTLSGVGSVDDLASSLAPPGSESGGGMIGMALGMVYPTLKPMLEASIRKVKVTVLWKEGSKERSIQVVQYVTNPLEGSLNPNAAEGIDDLVNTLGGGLTGDSTGDADSGSAQ